MKYNNNTTVYYLNVTDVQEVAKGHIDRKLTQKEIAVVHDKVGDFIDWRQAIENTINLNLNIKTKEAK